MRTRNADNQKSGTPAKKTAARKAAAKTSTPSASPKPTEVKPSNSTDATLEAETPGSVASGTPSVKAKSLDSEATLNTDWQPETADEQTNMSAEDPQTTPSAKVGKATSDNSSQVTPTTKKTTRKVVRKKVVKKTPASAKAGSAVITKRTEADEGKVEESSKEENVVPAEETVSPMNKDLVMKNMNPVMQEDPDDSALQKDLEQKVEDTRDSQKKGKTKLGGDLSLNVDPVDTLKSDPNVAEVVENDISCGPCGEPMTVVEEKVEPCKAEGKENVEQKVEHEESKQDSKDHKMTAQSDCARPNDDEDHPNAEMVEYGEEEGFVEPGDEELQEDDGLETAQEGKASEEEQMELTAAANERKIKKELEVFVGGLDRDVVEEDVKRAYEKVGDVVEVRLLKDPSTNRNRGFAFVRFATKEQASRALLEMKNPVIRGKRCGTAPREDNDVLFVGNICNTWTKEAIKQKLKDYGAEGVEYITLVQDPRHEGLSRGFCFIQFDCHADAMHAYKRLQKPDAVFGHAERTAKVAFAEPLREPDPEIMSKVKSVFVDGLPPHWDEDRVRENFKPYGDIERITLARNMSSAKRKDFGFVDFTTHEAAVACAEDVNSRELTDGNSRAKVRVRLSNPMPKTQAVKGGMCGGFRIGRPTGRSFGRGGRPFNHPNFQYGRGRGFYPHGRTQYVPVAQYPDFHDRRPFPQAGRRGAFHGGLSGDIVPARPNAGLPRYGRPVPSREVFPPEEEGFPRSFAGRHFDEPYPYDNRAPGVKRPFYMTGQDPAYMEPSRVRPRFDYNDSVGGSRNRDSFGPGSSVYPSGYYGSEYGAGPYSSYRGGDRSHGRGSYGGGSYGGGFHGSGSHGGGSYGGGAYGGGSYGGGSYGGGSYYY